MSKKPLRIAIVDDDQSVRTALGRLLKACEMEVDAYASGLEFFHAIETHNPDCLVLDLQMAGISGLEVMQYLNERGFHIPTVVITAHDGPGARESCFGAGAHAYLRKPFDADELIQHICKAVAVEAG